MTNRVFRFLVAVFALVRQWLSAGSSDVKEEQKFAVDLTAKITIRNGDGRIYVTAQ
jgi:hypothetical protein